MQVEHLGPNKGDKGDDAHQHADDVNNVVAVLAHVATAAAIDTSFLVGLHRTREWFCYDRSLEPVQRRRLAGMACRHGEVVDQTQNEEPRESSAKI